MGSGARFVMALGATLLMSSSSALAERPLWSFDPPATWTNVSAEARPALEAFAANARSQGGRADVTAYLSPNGDDAVSVIALVAPMPRASVQSFITGWAESGRASTNRDGTEISYRRIDSPTQIDIRQTTKVNDVVVYKRALAGLTTSQMISGDGSPRGEVWGVSLECRGSSQICSPILLSLSLDPARLATLPTGDAATSYAYGKIAGFLVLAVLVGLWLRSHYRRSPAG